MSQRLRKIAAPWIAGSVIALMSACGGPRVVLVPHDELVRAGPDVQGRVYVMTDEGWTLSQNRIDIPEGLYIGDVDASED